MSGAAYMKNAGLIVGLFLLGGMWPTEARAQLTAPREAAQIEFGPVSLYPSVRILEAGRDTNVFNEETNPKADDTFTLNARMLAVMRLGASELLLSSGSDYVWFKEYVEERSGNAQYGARLNLLARRLKPYVGAEYLRTRARQNAEIDARARRLDRFAVAGVAYAVSERLSVTASTRLDELTYAEGETFRGVDLHRQLNRRSQQYVGGVRYALTPLTTLVVGAEYGEDRFPSLPTKNGASYGASAGLEFSPEAVIHGNVTGGFEIFRPVDRTLSEYRGAVLAGELEWLLFERTVLGVRANRNIGFSYRVDEPYYLSTGVRLRAEQPLMGPVSVHGGAGWESMSYRWQLGAQTAFDDRADTAKSVSGGVGVNLNRGVRISITAERSVRDATRSSVENYRRVRFLSAVTIGS